MHKKIIFSIALALAIPFSSWSQEGGISTSTIASAKVDSLPNISYMHPVTKTIAEIRVSGAGTYDESVLRNLSGLAVGDEIQIPGPQITRAVNKYMQYGFFSNAKIIVTKYDGDKAYLEIQLNTRPRIEKLIIEGVSNSDREDLEQRLNLRTGSQLSPNIIDRTKQLITKYYDEKGYRDMSMAVEERAVEGKTNYVDLVININKNDVVKVRNLFFEGNKSISDYQLRRAMEKTNEKFSLTRGRWLSSFLELFSSAKFVDKDYKEDLKSIIDRYHQDGFRDAEIISDSIVVSPDKKNLDIYIKINEGPKYYIKDLRFVGNTKYSSDALMRVLNIRPGDLYDQKKLSERLQIDDDAITNLYYNNGYIFAGVDPVETRIEGDSVSLDIRLTEGQQATINKVIIKGNKLVYDNVVRRELYTKPGTLFSREDLKNSFMQINQMGYFDAENSAPKPIPNPQEGTVDIEYELVGKSNDQFNVSFGWSSAGIIGNVGLTFNNFSIKNLFNPSMYRGFIPQGDGQKLSIQAQSNARYYNNVSLSFSDPWFGGKRPNLLSVSAYYSRMTAIDQKYYNNQISDYAANAYLDPYYGGGYGGYGAYGGYGGYGGRYGGGYGYGAGSNLMNASYDSDKSLSMFGLSIGNGRRLNWPDYLFQVYMSLNYNLYMLNNWTYQTFQDFHDGVANDINFEVNLQRNSIDNPIYTRSGSDFMVSLKATLPYSLFEKKGKYDNPDISKADLYRWIEYYKWKFSAKTFLPLMNPVTTKRTPVLMARFEGGLIGSYTANKKSPFGNYYMGGDMMSAAYNSYLTETIGLRGYQNGAIAGSNYDYATSYFKVATELRYPIIFEQQATIWALAFLEAGNAWTDNSKYNPFNIKRSAGLGVRVYIPLIGIVGLDWGYGFDKGNNGQIGGSNIHFVLGQDL